MATTDVEKIRKELADINAFVRERFDPVTQDIGLLREETERLGREVVRLQGRERAVRRDALASYADGSETPAVTDGPFAGMDMLDLGLIRRFARSQRRERRTNPRRVLFGG